MLRKTRIRAIRTPKIRWRGNVASLQPALSAIAQLESETHFQLSPDAILVTDTGGLIRAANLRSAELFGYTREEFVGKLVDDLVPERFRSSHPTQRENYSAHPRTRPMGSSTTLFGLRKDGSEFPADIMLKRMEDGFESYVMSYVRDITEQRAAQESAHHKDRLLRSVVDSINDYAIYFLDSEGRVKTWNAGGQHITGYAEGEIVGVHFSRFFTQEDLLKGRPNYLLRQATECSRIEDEGWRVRKDSSRFWTDSILTAVHGADGKLIGFAKVSRDSTGRKQGEDAVLKEFSTKLQATATALNASEARYLKIFQASPEAVAISRVSDGAILDCNQAFLDVTGYEREVVLGRTTSQLGIWVYARDRVILLDSLRTSKGCKDLELQFRRKDREIFWARLSASLIEVDGTACVLSFARDISESKLAQDEITKLAFYDSLTGLPNRRLLLDRLQHCFTASARSNSKGAVLFIDLDDFKSLNDTLGHNAGDLHLRETGKRLSACMRESDTVARIGGDEFVVIVECLGESSKVAATSAKAVAEKISGALAEPYMLNEHQYFSSASIGIRVFTGKQDNIDEVMQHADIAMYESKAVGRNFIQLFTSASQTAINDRELLIDDIRDAIGSSQLRPYYQPQVEGGLLVGVEVLLRWMHPRRGFLPPQSFLPIAEQTGLICPLGDWIMETAFLQAAAWGKRKETEHLSVAINVSPVQFRQTGFVERVLTLLGRCSLNPRNIILELTESVSVDNLDDVVAKMAILKSRGLRFSLDDFGTGYSSLSHLRQLPLDQVKIDRSFIRDMLVDSGCRVIAHAIISMSRAMGLSVMAEGVETDEQRNFLAQMGCHSLQGYLFSPALPLDEFESWRAGFIAGYA